MAWRWWWARRRPNRRWTRRRWRRLRTRRPRRPVRRRRRRQRVRRRRWGRRRGRRRFYRRRFRKRRKRRRKLTLKTWNPSTIRACNIKGAISLVMCGHTQAGRNYAIRSEDFIPQLQSFGGSFSTTTWSLKVLFDEYQKFHNFWTYPNTQLDLCRYKYSVFTFYRDPKVDYIVIYNTNPPFKINKYSSPFLHPGLMMLQKKKILVPSFQTKPGGKARIKVRIKPPPLFEDKWYTQQDLCPVNLLSLAVSACSFLHPFCSPESDTICVTFQVLQDFYYTHLTVTPTTTTSLTTEDQTIFNQYLYKNANFYQSLHAPAIINANQQPAIHGQPGITTAQGAMQYLSTAVSAHTFRTGNNSIYGQPNYRPKSNELHALRKWFFTQTTTVNEIHGTYGKPTYDGVEYHLGKYSPIFLSPYRTNTQFPTAYRDITYNPNVDKGKGNKIWLQSTTKKTSDFEERSCRCVISDLPLWAIVNGYADFAESELGSEVLAVYVCCIICPYTKPALYNKSKPEMGYIFYDTLFGDGKLPTGTGLVPFYWQSRWYPKLAWQLQVMHDLYVAGPFSYKDDLKSFTINTTYKFKFLWGGNMIPEQVIKNPCKTTDPTFTLPGRQPRDLQVVDPLTMGPQWEFHTWDWRRGLFGQSATRRVSEKPGDDAEYYAPPKKPRFFPPTDLEEQEKDSDSQKETRLLFHPSSPSSQEEIQQEQQRDLHLRLGQQLRIRQQLQQVFLQVLKTQANLHINPLFLNQQ
nr:MAG: ORF1 [Torque teno virus]